MQKTAPFLFIACLLFIVACQPQAEDCPEQRYATSGPEIDLIKAHIQAYTDGDLDKWASYYGEQVKFHHNTWDAITNKEEMVKSETQLRSYFAEVGFATEPVMLERIIDDEGRTWVRYSGNWTGTIKANDEQVAVPVHLNIHLVDDKIVEEYGYWDSREVMADIEDALVDDIENPN
ncbi:MAG: nuclear transport factor 2 family protein [Bacteroidota bacterium]